MRLILGLGLSFLLNKSSYEVFFSVLGGLTLLVTTLSVTGGCYFDADRLD